MPCLAAALPLAAAAGTVLAQDAPPEGIGSDIIGIAREAADDGGSARNPAETDPPASASQNTAPVVTAGQAPPDAIIAPTLPAGTDPDGSASQPDPASEVTTVRASTTGTGTASAPASADETPEREAAAAERPAPLDLLRGLWREAVASGQTADGFEAWLSAALRPEPRAAAPISRESHADRTREAAAAWSRRAGPVTLGKAGRVVTIFGEAIPTAFCSPLTICYIELEPGEQLTDTPSVGDAVRWQVAPKIQGREPETVVLEIKPASDAVETNLVIPTDRRLYTIQLVNDPEVHTPILAFRWPDSEARAIADGIRRRRAAELAAEEARGAEAEIQADVQATEMARSGVPTDSGPRAAELLDFRFRVDGKAQFRPVRVFADGSRTYFDFHPGYRGPLPAIVAGKAEGNAALNTRISASGSRLVADRVITDVWLQSGRERVRIRRLAN